MNVPNDHQKSLISEAIRLLSGEYEENEKFNRYFDGEEPLTIASPREDRDAYIYERSKALFWLDRDAYEDERAAWDNKSLEDEHAEVLRMLSDDGLIQPFLDLADAIARHRIVPMVGAGMSRAMGMPLWGDALRALHNRICQSDDPDIAALIDQGCYLEAAQRLLERNGTVVNNFIKTTFQVKRVDGPILLLPRIAHGCIVTTNFDNAIEKVFERESLWFDSYMHGTQEHKFFPRLVRGQRCLLKLHGDADDIKTYILTKGQYETAYGDPIDFHNPLPKALRQIFISNSLLFIGCSLEQDWTLELFKYVKQQSEYEIPDHFAILPKPDSTPLLHQKEAVLLELNIQPIWYPAGAHHMVEKMLKLATDVADKRMTL